MAPAHHVGGNSGSLLRHRVLQKPLLVSDRPQDDRRRVAIALHHQLELLPAFGARTHLAGLAHHHHTHSIARFHPLRRGRVVRGANGIAAHVLQHSQAEPLQPVGESGPHSGVIVMIAGALDLQLLSIQKKALVCIEYCGADAKGHPFSIGYLPVSLNGNLCGVKVRLGDRPQRRFCQSGTRNIGGGPIRCNRLT